MAEVEPQASKSSATRLLHELVFSRLGRCPKCMRKAFMAMLATWLVFAAAVGVGAAYLPALALFPALATSALWLGHLVLFARRNMANRIALGSAKTVLSGRRAAIAGFSRGFALAVLAMALPSTGRSQSVCGCRVGDVCCNSKTLVTWECVTIQGCTQWILRGKPCTRGQARCN